RIAEEADDLAVLRVRGHSVPGLRRELRRALLDDRVEALGESAIRRRHRGDRGAHGALAVLGRLQLLGARSHRRLFLCRESLLLLALPRTGAHRSPFVCSTTCAKRSSRCSHVLMPSKAYGASVHLRARPTFTVVTRFACSSSRTCFFMPVRDMPKG